ncbi:FadR/GntR family transcriptional regulator [Pimelobacter simplex]|uniref:FadR/GntR family transcriptional regulator n=1 Tax=Nocardioides simplex TaxID=2045 RepID=UPI00381D96AF
MTTSSTSGPKRTRLSDQVADALIQQVVAQELKPGDRLPTEPELVEQFDVSRTVIREASRILVERGLVEIRPRTGMVVADFDGTGFARQFELLLQMKRGSFRELMEMRLALEVGMIEHAAERYTADDRRHIEDALRSFEGHDLDHATALEADLEFHSALAEASHNPFFTHIINPINDYLRGAYRPTLGYEAARENTLREHQEIADAVFARDVSGAGQHARQHLMRVLADTDALLD